MARFTAFLAAMGLAAGAVGCAQCDTCDDFPAPCTGPNCGYQYGASAAPVAYSGPVVEAAPAQGPASLGPASDSAPALPEVNPGSKPVAPAVKPNAGSPFETTPPRPTEPSKPGL